MVVKYNLQLIVLFITLRNNGSFHSNPIYSWGQVTFVYYSIQGLLCYVAANYLIQFPKSPFRFVNSRQLVIVCCRWIYLYVATIKLKHFYRSIFGGMNVFGHHPSVLTGMNAKFKTKFRRSICKFPSLRYLITRSNKIAIRRIAQVIRWWLVNWHQTVRYSFLISVLCLSEAIYNRYKVTPVLLALHLMEWK